MNNDKKRVIEDGSLPVSVRSVVRMYPSNQVNRLHYGGLPHIGNALWGTWSSEEIQKAAGAYENYSLSTNLLIEGFPTPDMNYKVRLGGGSPAKFEPFKECLDDMQSIMNSRVLSDYPLAAGDPESKISIIDYYKTEYLKEITENNIIFTHSSTQAFTLVMEAILDYGDVVLMTAPNYGLFTFIPERVGGRVRLLGLSSDDQWKINPDKLKKLIGQTNDELKVDYDQNRGRYTFRRSDTPPKVSAFVNYNPHNPTGVVYSEKDRPLLVEIGNICKEAGVFVVDDLAYAGLEYDRDNPALPICSLPGQFDNTITLYTLSKSYGLAGLRSGMVVANEIVSSFIRDRIFQSSDSLSILQSAAMGAVFKTGKESREARERYFSYTTLEYYERYVFVKSIIRGNSLLTPEERLLLDNVVRNNNLPADTLSTMGGIAGIDIVLEPESGFFVLLDLTKLLGKSYKGFRVVDDKTLLQFLYTSGNIKILTGNAFCWPNQKELVVRATVAHDYQNLMESYQRLKESIGQLKD